MRGRETEREQSKRELLPTGREEIDLENGLTNCILSDGGRCHSLHARIHIQSYHTKRWTSSFSKNQDLWVLRTYTAAAAAVSCVLKRCWLLQTLAISGKAYCSNYIISVGFCQYKRKSWCSSHTHKFVRTKNFAKNNLRANFNCVCVTKVSRYPDAFQLMYYKRTRRNSWARIYYIAVCSLLCVFCERWRQASE